MNPLFLRIGKMWSAPVSIARLSLLLMAALAPTALLAATCTSIASGNWNASTTWSCTAGTTPATGDTVIVVSPHAVSLNNGNRTAAALTIDSGATLNDDGRMLTITGNVVNNGTVGNNGGSLSMTGTNATLSGTGTFDGADLEIDGTGISLLVGATMSFSNQAQVRVGNNNQGSFTINGTITGTALASGDRIMRVYQNSSVTANGTINAPNAYVRIEQTASLANNGTASIQYLRTDAASSTWTQGASSTLTVSQTPSGVWNGVLNASATGNWVNYTGTATPLTPSSNTYYNIYAASCAAVSGFTILGVSPCVVTVSSINRAGTDPTSPATVVSWTVTFSASVTGVDATDFSLIQSGGVSAAAITGVTGSGTTWTVTANTGAGTGTLGLNLVDDDSIVNGANKLGGTGTNNGNFTGQAYTVMNCYTDSFTGADGASPGADWTTTSSSGGFGQPRIIGNRLRLTDATNNVATAAHLQRMFPGAGNKIIIEFDHFAYDGTGADGIAVTLSDASVTPQAGAYGGSLGYAQRTGVNGFAGGWIGLGIDEYGNFANPTEGRSGGTGFVVDSVAVRGSGSGTTGYAYHAGSGTLSPGIDSTTAGVTYVGRGTAAAASSGSVTPTLPAHVAGDLLVCLAESHDTNAHSVATAGWTQYYSLTGTTHRASLYYKIATSAAEADPTITHSGGNSTIARCAGYRGVDTTTPFDVAYAAALSGSDNTIETGSQASVAAGYMVLFAGHVANNPGSSSVTTAGGLTWTQAFHSVTSSGSDSGVMLFYATHGATAGALGPLVATTSSQAGISSGVLMVLRPQPSAGPGYRYRIVVDHSNGTNAYVTVERNTGSGYATVIPQYDAKVQSGQAAVPTNWLLSYTGSTGASNNIHEIDNLSVCASQPILAMSLDHVRLNHTGTAVTCLGEQVTVTACDSVDSSGTCTANTAGLTGNVIAKSSGGTTLATVPFTIPAGSSSVTVTVPVTSAQTVTFETSGLSATPTGASAWTCWNGSAASCSNIFSDAGFILASAANGTEATLPTQTAGTASGTYYLRAVKTDKVTKVCEAALAGANTVNFGYECVNPTTCYTGNLMNVNGGTDTTIARNDNGSSSSTTAVAMTFDANGNAPFTFNYSDVGQVRLWANKTVSGAALTGSSNAFVVKPYGFKLAAACTADGTANAASQSSPGTGDPKFCRSGAAFSATATAIASSGTTTPNYGRETTPETAAASWSRHLPTGTGTSDGTLPSGGFTYNGGYTGSFTATGLSWTEVGILKATVSIGDGSYLGAGDVSGTAYVGRFYPHHFDTTLTAQCGGFAYSGRPETTVVPGQPFGVTATAKNAAGGAMGTTVNYASATGFAKAVDLTVATGGGSGSLYVDSTAGGTGAIPAAKFSDGIGTVNHSDASGKISFVFSTFPTAATTINLHAEDADTPTSVGSDGSIGIRAGRLRLSNAFGRENANLVLPVQVQYWSGNSWVLNSDDTCTGSGLNANAVALSGYTSSGTPALAASNLGPSHVSGFTADGGGKWNLTLTKPSPAATGSVDVCVDVGTDPAAGVVCSATSAAQPWLQSKWPPGTGYNNDPSARATFGIYSPETKKTIHVREQF